MVLLTGAGASAESGVPTFRGATDSLWEQRRPEELATPQAFARDPELVWRFYRWRRELVAKCSPNPAHHVLAAMEREVDDFTLITQNIDGLHQSAGSRRVIELHGSLWQLRCTRRRRRWESRRSRLPEGLPECPACGGLARPGVVWFGEGLQPEVLREAYAAARQAGLMVVVGTSALVQPAAHLPRIAKESGAYLVEFNLTTTPLSPLAHEVHRGPAGVKLPRWWRQIRGSISKQVD